MSECELKLKGIIGVNKCSDTGEPRRKRCPPRK